MVGGLTPRDLIALAREAQRGVAPTGPIVVWGPAGSEVAAALREGGRAELVVVDGDPERGSALVVVLDGQATDADLDAMRRATRAGMPVVALARGPVGERPPYVLATDLLEWPPGTPVPTRALAGRLAAGLLEAAVGVAAGLPAVRAAVVRRRAGDSAVVAGMIALLRRGQLPVSPVITLLQARMLRQVEAASGKPVPVQPQAAIMAAAPEVAAAMATGLLCRTAARALPVRGRLLDAGVAYGGTLALAQVASRVLARR